MSTTTGQLVDSTMIRNSWSGDSNAPENKMHELTVVNVPNLHQSNSVSNYNNIEHNTSNQLPLTILQDADSTVIDNYNFNNQGESTYMNGNGIYEQSTNLMNITNSSLQSMINNNELVEQQVYYESTNDKMNEQIYAENYQYNDNAGAQTNQANQINAFGDQIIANQTYDYNVPNEMVRNSSQSTPSINTSFSNSSNSSTSAHSTQLLDLSTYSNKINSYHSNKTNQTSRAASSDHSRVQSKSAHKHYSSLINKTTGERKLLRPHSTPATLIWLSENYEIADGVCIPRSTLYSHYVDFCSKNCIQPVNAASFGKIIRQQFPQLTTRRLGTRGQSRYHYYGIAVKEHSLYHQQAYSKKSLSLTNSSYAGKESASVEKARNTNDYFRTSQKDNIYNGSSGSNNSTASIETASANYLIDNQSARHQQLIAENNLNSSNNVSMNTGAHVSQNSMNNSLSINVSTSNVGPSVNLPEFPNVKELRLRTRSHYSNKHLIGLYSTFLMMYRTHCQRILDTLIRCNLSELNKFISYFWQAVPEHLKCVLAEPVFHCLIAICDCLLYKCITQILSAPLLQSSLPENLIKILAKFSDQLEINTRTAMCKQPEALRCVKLALSHKSACLLRRQSCLSKFICETRIALSDHNTRKMLVGEFRRVDMSIIFSELFNKLNDYQIQIITTAISEFEILFEESFVDNWQNWINSLLNKCIFYPSPNFSFALHARQFVRIWNLFSLNILKQLNSMMSPLYKIFILIRNLFSVYILYTLEYLHFDERIKEFTLSLYQEQCPQIVEPFFQDSVFDLTNELSSDFKIDYNTMSNIKSEHEIKMEMGDLSTVNYLNSKPNMINSDYDAEMYSFYNSDYYSQPSLHHESSAFAFNASNYHRHQLVNPTPSNYQSQPSELNNFNNHHFHHQMNNYCAGLNQSANHHHLHHHLHQQTYHLIINSTSTNNIDSTHYHLDSQDNSQAINYNLNNNNNIVLPFQANELNTSQPDQMNCNLTSRKYDQQTNDRFNPEVKLASSNYQNGVF